MRAVQIKEVFGYDTSNFPSADLQVSMDGWRKFTVIQLLNLSMQRECSRKPGKRLIGSHYREALRRMVQLGPASSSWHQGAVESLIKAVKCTIHFSAGNQ